MQIQAGENSKIEAKLIEMQMQRQCDDEECEKVAVEDE